jgi:rhodanese-related sulfurtransferase
MLRSVWRRDLAWAAFIFLLAAAVGLLGQWPLVRLSWQGELRSHLDQLRTQRREVQFQGVPTLSLAQAYELFQQGQALFIDARPPQEYQELHVAGAVNLPVEQVQGPRAQEVAGADKGRRLVVYCGQVSCDAALTVAEKLQSLGFNRVAVFLGGFRAWDEAGYPADTSK